MATLALALFVLYFVLAFGARTVLQKLRTGSSGFKGVSEPTGSVEWFGGVLFAGAVVAILAAPLLDLAGGVAQVSMGRSWRIGVDDSEKTDLVTSGPFAMVRNPIFAAMIPAFLGLALLVPNFVALAGFAALVVAVELQVRCVEEPYLMRVHGDRYIAYASRVGRFAPGVGTIRPKDDRP